MTKNANWQRAAWLLVLVTACGQELTPPVPRRPNTNAPESPSEGTTGDGGADAAAPSRQPLPLPDRPIYTTFGGASDDEPGGTSAETGGRGGAGAAGMGGERSVMAGAATAGGLGGTSPTRVDVPTAGRDDGGTPSVSGSGSESGSSAGSGSGSGSGSSAGSDAGSSGGTASSTPETPAKALLFSEYLEGAGSLKALEIFAVEAGSLEGCELDTYFNGKAEPTRLTLHGSLDAGAVQVLCSSAMATLEPTRCQRSTNLTFNGNDALALSCDGVLLDVIGQIGVDPGDSWGMGATVDHSLRRNCSVTTGRIDGAQPFEPELEWTPHPADDRSDLGKHDCLP